MIANVNIIQMNCLWILMCFVLDFNIPLVGTDNIVSIDKASALNKYCRDKERLITSDENDEYMLVSAEVGAIVIMECRFCNDKEEVQTKIWYFRDPYESKAETPVDLGMDNNSSYNRIYTTPELNLVIKDFQANDSGIYLCHGEEGQEMENKFNYRIEPIFKDYGFVHTEEGNMTDWEKYSEIYLSSITTRFAVSRMSDLAEIRKAGVILRVVSEWGPWGPCEQCVRNQGYKTSRGLCRLKRTINKTVASKEDDSLSVRFFQKSPSLPCKSLLLQEEFPSISSAIINIPEFILKETCKKCPKVKKKRGKRFRYVRRYVLAEGAYLTVPCPESSMDNEIVWKKDAITLEKGVRRTFHKKEKDVHLIVDAFAILYLIDVSEHEQGNYTCYVDNIKMLQLKLIIVSKSKLLTQEFLRHLGYLGFILLMSSFCYCTGLVMAYRRRDTFLGFNHKTNDGPKEEEKRLLT